MKTLLFLLAASALLNADAFVTATLNTNCGSSVSLSDPVSVSAFVQETCDLGGASYSWGGSAGGMTASAGARVDVSGTVQVVSESIHGYTVTAPSPGLYTLSFGLAGELTQDAGHSIVSFSVSGTGLNAEWLLPGRNHWVPFSETFTSAPVLLDCTPYTYRTDVKADATGYAVEWGMASADLSATFLGLSPVAAVPEPSTIWLLGSGAILLFGVRSVLLRTRFRLRL